MAQLIPGTNIEFNGGDEGLCKLTLEQMASHFEVCVPRFRYNRSGRGIYYPDSKTVTIGRSYKYHRTAEHSIIHEFAHHLADERDLAYRAVFRAENEQRRLQNLAPKFYPFAKRRHHDKLFCEALFETAAFYYGTASEYSWETEYTSVAKWAFKHKGMKRAEGRFKSRTSILESMGWKFIKGLGWKKNPQPTMDFGPGRLSVAPAADPNVQFVDLGQTAKVTVTFSSPSRRDFTPFRSDLAVQYYRSGMKISQIARELNGGRKFDHTRGLVLQAVKAAGIYKEPVVHGFGRN